MAYKTDKKIVTQKVKKYIKLMQENGFDIWRLYLFGSYMTKNFTGDSDIDLAIFLRKADIDGFDEDIKLMHLRRKVDLRIEPHSFAMSDFDESNPFIKQIVTTGKRII